MPKTDEKLADILAEMRKAVVPMICGRPKIEAVSIGDVLQWADRIEAAAERERDDLVDAHDAIARLEAELAEVRRERDTLAAERALGNAAAMRAALEWVADFSSDDYVDDVYSTDGENLQKAAEKARAALAAPARNCDRFKTAVGAMEEWEKYPQSRYKGCRVCPHGDSSMVSPSHLTLAEWLFAPAKGGAE